MKTITTKKKNTWDIISDYRGVLMGISIICIIVSVSYTHLTLPTIA